MATARMARTLGLLLACAAAADAAEVVRLDMDSWAELVAGSPHAWVIEFSSKYCETCKQFAPEWEKLTAGEGLVDGVRFGHVGIDDKPAKLLARELGAMKAGIPNVSLLPRWGEPLVPVMAGKVVPAATVAAKLTAKLEKLGLPRGADGLYVSGGDNAGLQHDEP